MGLLIISLMSINVKRLRVVATKFMEQRPDSCSADQQCMQLAHYPVHKIQLLDLLFGHMT
jgi:hypothetical protein